MAKDTEPAAAPEAPTVSERIASRPMRDVAAALQRVKAHCLYSDDSEFLRVLAALCDSCGELSFADFASLLQGDDNEAVGSFFRDLQERVQALETQLRASADELALAKARVHELELELAGKSDTKQAGKQPAKK